MRRFIAIAALLAAFILPASTLATPPAAATAIAPVTTDASAYCADSAELDMLRLINAYRAEHGIAPLSLSVTLGAAAKHHSESMAEFNYFDASHDLHFEGENQDQTITWQENIQNYGYPDNTRTSRAENLAAGYESAAETLVQWQTSSSHDEQLLDPKYQVIGIGRAFNPESEYKWYWTVTFGSLLDSKALACDSSGDSDDTDKAELTIVRGGRNGSSSDSSAAYDGDLATTWHTTKARTPASGYVWFDLGDIQTLSSIDYYFAIDGSADAFEIQVSSDREEWITVAELGNPPAGEWLTLTWSGQARYVRFLFDNPNGDDVLGYLAEVRFHS